MKAQTDGATTSPDDNIVDINEDVDGMLYGDIARTKVKDLPNCAREILRVLNNCKETVKYIKLVSKSRLRDE